MNIYLDIDGVLLANDKEPALHADEFIKHVVTNYPTFWLTTHCRTFADDPVTNLLIDFFDRSTVELLYRIKPTRWDMLKTEGIDFSQPFLWFDDQPLAEDLADLADKGRMDSWVEVALEKDPHQLQKLIRQMGTA